MLIHGDCLEVMKTLDESSVDAIATDPPYGLSFMGKNWDHGIPGVAFWQAALRVLKPAGYALIFGGSRTYHRLACAVEDAGFEIRDCVIWVYGSGFPKGKGNLKPAYEPILLCRKPGKRVKELGIDECRVTVEASEVVKRSGETALCPAHEGYQRPGRSMYTHKPKERGGPDNPSGRWPANIMHDGSEEVMEAFAAFGGRPSGGGVKCPAHSKPYGSDRTWNVSNTNGAGQISSGGDTGTAARFFYCAKASRSERGEGNTHPTVKPLSLMQWCVRLISRPGDTILDPFAGSGTTLLACQKEGRHSIGIEREESYIAIARKRLSEVEASTPLFTESAP